jgi:hypothetical protein
MAVHLIQVLLFTAYAIFAESIFLINPVIALPSIILLGVLPLFLFLCNASGTCTNIILYTQKRE